MIGDVKVLARNKNNNYEFVLHRNITVLRGNSGSGKTKLFELVSDNNRYGKNSDAKVSCDYPVVAYDGKNWERDISEIHSSVIIIDEENSVFINSSEFAKCISKTDNYYLLITRNYLPQLPYSVDEIYELRGRGKTKRFVKAYESLDYMYVEKNLNLPYEAEVIIAEDSGSGYQFWTKVAEKKGIECISAGGKSNINKLITYYADKRVLVIADGAAFGPEIDRIAIKQANTASKIAMCLPESFEWLILASGILENRGVSADDTSEDIRLHTIDIDSSKFFSWEQYFTYVLENATSNSRFCKYSKRQLTDFYLEDANIADMLALLQSWKQ